VKECAVILSEAKDPLIFCGGSFGVFAPQDDEKTGRGFGPANESAPEPSFFSRRLLFRVRPNKPPERRLYVQA